MPGMHLTHPAQLSALRASGVTVAALAGLPGHIKLPNGLHQRLLALGVIRRAKHSHPLWKGRGAKTVWEKGKNYETFMEALNER
jgi:hypothetical protein